MNNKYFASLLCITALTFAPACTKKQESYSAKASKDKEDINTMIELETEVFEMAEDTEIQKSIVKF